MEQKAKVQHVAQHQTQRKENENKRTQNKETRKIGFKVRLLNMQTKCGLIYFSSQYDNNNVIYLCSQYSNDDNSKN